MSPRTLSVVIPAHNEERFIGELLRQLSAVDLQPLGLAREVIAVDDGSSDRTAEIVRGFPDVRLHRLPRHAGKGAAVRAGLDLATGDLLLIQDADLEYDPRDHVPMLRALLAGRGEAVYGSRYLEAGRRPSQSVLAYLGGRSLSPFGWLCTGRWLTDPATALKLFPRALLASLALSTSGFELDHEITAKVLARGCRIAEVPVRYRPRSRAEGKKIGVKDWFVACGTFIRYRNG
ncbi:MAG TPA: glycosyltransferase family 2 protein [Vicinamibacterales bacterium]|nr:glycosyltransferase family 2 protein [Vicinamibacterales bacterium]